ncbi:hypothetical protein [Methyloradius palustris]|uniref:DUF2946 domain-containing protein n=1 Tax=Methyloradius palustris TaxID=2778876 RepID=A0A8D5FXC4_9PROT|nr:hypothetical protein [Methyloradius palustris]BCM23884.1 hypothetical protein ZMTM_01430 [Methyloradius palustris]
MFRRFLLPFSLILLFGIAQLGALTHEISHFTTDLARADIVYASETTSQISATQKTPQDNAPDTPFCAKCLSYGALAHTVHATNFTVVLFDNSFEIQQAEQHNSYLKPLLLSYAARAPPVLA